MYVVTSMPFERRTRATLRSAEFGFFGVVVYTRVQTPRFCGQASSAGTLFLIFWAVRGLRISWLIVGIRCPLPEAAERGRFPCLPHNGENTAGRLGRTAV